ncbi:hypothetical protein Prum_060120 [Phytohabitans rumicis]|uniref:Extradiol ring-cleavage dioxygenase class III enzyme subunit B domain-containing protein n=1 Tax=Phytohabitans rumicis TaxID=1076125 RepID=A0A6V8L9S9_9ACTN|nr:hypothetical protein Prum_060120 [Phytohabitans rumicis]
MTRLPAIYLSHGAPPLADDPLWTRQLAAWSAELPRPRAILVASAHWEAAPTAVGATTTVPLTYDFYGFPRHYYEVTYPAPGAPELAADVGKLLGGVHEDPDRGLDHGRTYRWWRCTRRRTSRCCRSPCRASTRRCCWRSGGASRRCGTRAY